MINKRAKRVIAVIGLLVMCVSSLASCQVGGTYAEKPGNQEVIQVASKDKPIFQKYTGKVPVEIIETEDPAYKPQGGGNGSGSNTEIGGNGGSGSGDVIGNNGNNDSGSNGNQNSGNGGGSNGNQNSGNNGGDDDWDEDEGDVKYDEANKLKIMAYNLRIANDSNEFGGSKEIKDRMPRFKKVMDMYQPDVAGFSECGRTHISFLQSDYSSTPYGMYNFHYTWRAKSSEETTPIMWNTSVLEKLEHGTFWLSDTPDKESKATNWGEKGADCHRIVCWAKLKVKATGKIFIFFSTHFDFSDEVHINSVNLIHKKAKEMGAFSKYAFFFVGDCNMAPWGKGYQAVYDTKEIADINWELNSEEGPGTCNGYHIPSDTDPTGEDGGGVIDYVFFSPAKVHPLHYEVIDVKGDDGDWVSDHRGLYAEAALL